MGAQWEDVIKAVSLLAYIVKRFDKNGVDLRFTMDSKKYTCKHTQPIVSHVRAKLPSSSSPDRITNMEAKLEDILGDYRADLSKKYGSSLWRRSCKKTILFVFTDGVWEPECNAEHPIRELVKDLKACSCPRNQYGIQFIQFGHDPSGSELLKLLDDLPDLDR
jgi:hypothetical protein